MAIKVPLSLNAPDDVITGYGANPVFRIQSATTETGTFADLAATPTEAIVAGTYRYEHWDLAGDRTTWYRWRLENAGGTETSDWSDPFQGIDAAAAARNAGSYASLDDYLLEVGQLPSDSRKLAAMERALVEARERLDTEIGYSAFRQPQSGTETRLYHGTGRNILHVHEGIVSLTSVEVRTETGGAWTTIETADWWLEGQPGQLRTRPGEPYFHVRLSDGADYTTFPAGEHRTRLVGAFGWAKPSQRHVGANIDLARQQIAADLSVPGGVVGDPSLGAPVGPSRLPDTVWRLKLAESRRFQCAI